MMKLSNNNDITWDERAFVFNCIIHAGTFFTTNEEELPTWADLRFTFDPDMLLPEEMTTLADIDIDLWIDHVAGWVLYNVDDMNLPLGIESQVRRLYSQVLNGITYQSEKLIPPSLFENERKLWELIDSAY